MGLETVTYISDLVATNPVGAVDPKSQGDDHIRNIKSALLATFPNITGAVTPTHTELNVLDGVTATTAELNILDGVTATAAELNTLDGITATVTELNGLHGSHNLPDSVLSTNVPLLDSANTFTADQQITKTSPTISLNDGSDPTWVIRLGSSGDFALSTESNTENAIVASQNASKQVTSLTLAADSITLNSINITDFARLSQNNAFTGNDQRISATSVDFSWLRIAADSSVAWFGVSDVANQIANGSVAGDAVIAGTSGVLLSGDGGSSAALRINSSNNFDFQDGTVTTSNASASEVGYKGRPVNAQSGSYTLVLGDAGKTIYTTVGGNTITIPLNSSVAFPVGTEIYIATGGSGNTTISLNTTDTLIAAGSGIDADGLVAFTNNIIVTLLKVASQTWIVQGS